MPSHTKTFRRRRAISANRKDSTIEHSTAAPVSGGSVHLPLFLRAQPQHHAQNSGTLNAVAANESENPLAPNSTGIGTETHAVAFGLSLRGRTDATFDGGVFATENVAGRRGRNCSECEGDECAAVSGVLVSTFSVVTSVTLPSVSDFPDLSNCQKQRVGHAISNVLAPHEQQHVRAFHSYDGVVRRSFKFTICRPEFDAAIQTMHNEVAASRESAARARSDALDPFNFQVDLDCKDPPAPPARKTTPDAGPRNAND
jgi:hypothetical protein